jgi:hypothetical protein
MDKVKTENILDELDGRAILLDSKDQGVKNMYYLHQWPVFSSFQ